MNSAETEWTQKQNLKMSSAESKVSDTFECPKVVVGAVKCCVEKRAHSGGSTLWCGCPEVSSEVLDAWMSINCFVRNVEVTGYARLQYQEISAIRV